MLATAILALIVTSGFTCSKNAPSEPTQEAPANQEQMAAPTTPPTEEAPAPESAPAASPTEAAPSETPAPAPGH